MGLQIFAAVLLPSLASHASDAFRTTSFEFRNVPRGIYGLRGTLISSAEKARATVRQHVTVIDPAITGITA